MGSRLHVSGQSLPRLNLCRGCGAARGRCAMCHGNPIDEEGGLCPMCKGTGLCRDCGQHSRALLRAEQAAAQINQPLDTWPGNCYGVATALVRKGVFAGQPRYGHWTGPLAPGTMYADKARVVPFISHGWIEQEGGIIVDPTRYVFEGVDPYIYQGENDHYDAGGNLLRQAGLKDVPKRIDTPRVWLQDLPPRPRAHLAACLQAHHCEDTVDDDMGLDSMQCLWIANAPLQMLMPHATAIYDWLAAKGLKAFVPMDNWDLAHE